MAEESVFARRQHLGANSGLRPGRSSRQRYLYCDTWVQLPGRAALPFLREMASSKQVRPNTAFLAESLLDAC
jgi:hypothetical protein